MIEECLYVFVNPCFHRVLFNYRTHFVKFNLISEIHLAIFHVYTLRKMLLEVPEFKIIKNFFK